MVRHFGRLKECFKNSKFCFATIAPRNFFTNTHFKLKIQFSNSLYKRTLSQINKFHEILPQVHIQCKFQPWDIGLKPEDHSQWQTDLFGCYSEPCLS